MLCVPTKPATARIPGPEAVRAEGRSDPKGRGDARSHDEWLATLAHELRSPLATVLFALDVIADGSEPDPGVRRAHEVAERQARQAMQLVDDIFDVCAWSRGKLSLRREAVDLAGVVARAAEGADHVITARRHRLTISLPPGPVALCADPLRLGQVLTNLLVNAAKYTAPGGHIRLTAEVEGGQIVLRVRDNGRGIAPEQLPQVFDQFWQGSEAGAVRGLGLGLALVKSLVELHGGSVAARSDGPGAGAEFIVRLPAGSPD
jgi:signal transduction histidine kinase